MTHLSTLTQAFAAARRREEGQTMTEYAIILTLITAAVFAVIGTLGTEILTVFNNVVGAF